MPKTATLHHSQLTSMTCGQCSHSRAHGSWSDTTITHCRDCHATWPLTKTRWAHCVRCHNTFGGDEAAVRHLDHQGNCVDPASVLHKVTQRRILTLNAEGVWSRVFGA